MSALRTLEAIANNLHTPGLKKALLASEPVAESLFGAWPPTAERRLRHSRP